MGEICVLRQHRRGHHHHQRRTHARTLGVRRQQSREGEWRSNRLLPSSSFLAAANSARLSLVRPAAAHRRGERERRRRPAAALPQSVRRSITPTCELRKSALPLSHEERAIQQCSVVYMNVCTVQPAGASSHTYGLPAFSSLRPRPSHSKNEVCSMDHCIQDRNSLGQNFKI